MRGRAGWLSPNMREGTGCTRWHSMPLEEGDHQTQKPSADCDWALFCKSSCCHIESLYFHCKLPTPPPTDICQLLTTLQIHWLCRHALAKLSKGSYLRGISCFHSDLKIPKSIYSRFTYLLTQIHKTYN